MWALSEIGKGGTGTFTDAGRRAAAAGAVRHGGLRCMARGCDGWRACRGCAPSGTMANLHCGGARRLAQRANAQPQAYPFSETEQNSQ
ncbi:hypothetical protein OR16_40064 [Cupriavidus basilensis OR16]|uniref:Uncharacterized protein n=1 Tax=Cupriavidus basilensis OR16 TaxID=1127483 RepID=H1SHR8_9BURK|nr:hypothetical protein OR16_40064 [Cupriavidus basilensis OR16]